MVTNNNKLTEDRGGGTDDFRAVPSSTIVAHAIVRVDEGNGRTASRLPSTDSLQQKTSRHRRLKIAWALCGLHPVVAHSVLAEHQRRVAVLFYPVFVSFLLPSSSSSSSSSSQHLQPTRHAMKAFRFITNRIKETKYNKNVRCVFSTKARPVRQQQRHHTISLECGVYRRW